MLDPKPLSEVDSVAASSLRIAVVRPFMTANKGGAERYALDLAGCLVALGHKVDLFANQWDRPERADIRYHRVPMVPKPGWLRVLTFHWNLHRVLDRSRYDLVLGMTPFAPQGIFWLGDGLYRVWTRVAWPNPVLRWLMCAKRAVMSINLWLERRIMKGGAKHFIVNSKLVKKQAMKDYGVPAERISLAYPGIDLARFHPGVRGRWRKIVRETLGAREDETVFLFVANNFKRKGLDRILHALAEMQPARAHLIVVGSGRRWWFARLASRLGVGAQVTFIGRTGEVEQFYGAADVFVLPTRYDPFATVCLEAMACGLPVITSEMNGAAELIRTGENGFVVNLSTRSSLAHAMRAFLEPGRRLAAGERAAQTARSFSFQDHMRQMTATLAAVGAKRELKLDLVQPESALVINCAFLPVLESRGLTSVASFLEARDAEQLDYNRRKQIHLFRLRVEDKPVTFYLKRHYSRLSWMDLWHKLVHGKVVTEGMQEWRNILAFGSCALPTVVPLAAGERFLPGGFKESFVMTKGLDGHVALDQYIGERFTPPLDARRRGQKRRLIAAAARFTRHFHWLGFNHRDYYLCHLFVRPGDDDANDLRIIDLQRVGYQMPFRARWIVKDLAALHYSSLGLPLTDWDRLRFYALYSCGQRGRKRQLMWVLRKSAAIARHDRRLRQSNEQEKTPPPNGGGSLGTRKSNTNEKLATFLVIGIFALALLTRLSHLTDRWSDYFVPNGWSHMGWSGAFYSTIGRNYLRYGLTTWLAPVVSTGPPLLDGPAFYPNHPPLLGWLIAISFAVFGEHEWATRLVPLVFSLCSLLVFYALVMRYCSILVAQIATLLIAVVPMAAYYLGSFPDVQGPHVLFFMLLNLVFYFRWIESGKRIYFLGLTLSILCGILSDWPGLYTPLVLVAYHGFTQSRDKFPPMAAVSVASVILTLALICYLGWLVYDPWILLKAFLFSSIASKPQLPNASSLLSSVFDSVTTVLCSHILYLNTPVVLSLATSYLIVVWSRMRSSRYPFELHLVSLLLILGSLHIGLGLRAAAVHSYWSMYLTPGLILAAALWLNDLTDSRARRSPPVRVTSLLVSCTVGLPGLYYVAEGLDWPESIGYFLAILLFGLVPFIPDLAIGRRWDMARITVAFGLVCLVFAACIQTRALWRQDNGEGLGAYRAAAVLRERTSAAEEILAGPSIVWGQNPPFTYYADRSFIRVDSIESLAAYENDGRFRYLILSKKDLDKDLAAHITPRFYAEAVGGYLLVDLKRPL